ncbi:MAG: mandelate racemase/muconate lactonizing enzyme family protein [Pirellulaceae bacterium]
MQCTIARIESFPVNYPTIGRFKFLEGPRGERLGRQTLVIKITGDDGTVGWGQSVPSHRWSYETQESVQTTIREYIAPSLLGLNAFDTDAVQTAMDQIIAPSFSTGQPICKAGIDLALFDLTGQRSGQAASERWGRQGQTEIRLSWTLNPRTLDELPAMIEEGQRKGYRNFNVKVAPEAEFDVEMCRMIRRTVPEGFLWADANGGYDEATALAVAPKLADVGVDVLEQPVRPNRLRAHQMLKRQGALPIILDEGVVNHAELEEFIRLGMLDGVAIKVARCGGLTEARRMIELVEQHGLLFLGSGLTDPDISLAASLLLYGAYNLQYPAALNGPQYLANHSILKRPLCVVGDCLAVPDGPGLGIEVDERELI